MAKKRGRTGLGWLPLVAALVGCGSEGAELFHGAGEFSLSIADADGKLTVQRLATVPRLALRRGQRGGTDLVLDRSCALRSLGGRVTGTYACRVASAAGAMVLELQSGTWKLTEEPSADSVGGCPLRRYRLVVDAAGSIRGRSGTAVTLHFEGSRELQDCSQGGDGISAGSLGSWTEDPYTGDSEWADGYDWDDDGDWDSGGDGDWGDGDYGDGDYGDGDYGDGEDGDYGDGDWGGDDSGDWGGDDGDGDGGDGGDWGGDDGDWATGHSSRAKQSRGAQSGKPRQSPVTSKARR